MGLVRTPTATASSCVQKICQSLGLKTNVIGAGQRLKKQVVSVAELLDVCWLDVRGKFDTAKLSWGATYEVAFVMMLKDTANGWEVPVDVSLILPNGNKQNRKENLMKRPRGEWIEIQAGKFVASPDMVGEMELSLQEHGGHWKSGLVIKGIAIRPQY